MSTSWSNRRFSNGVVRPYLAMPWPLLDIGVDPFWPHLTILADHIFPFLISYNKDDLATIFAGIATSNWMWRKYSVKETWNDEKIWVFLNRSLSSSHSFPLSLGMTKWTSIHHIHSGDALLFSINIKDWIGRRKRVYRLVANRTRRPTFYTKN